MKTKTMFALLAAAALSGCRSTSPYDHRDSWLIRDDPVRAFTVPADVFYVQGEPLAGEDGIPSMYSHAQLEVGNGRFAGFARVFSPLFSDAEDIGEAVEWYFRHHHEKNRPFVFIGEGEGGRMLKGYESRNSEKLKERGLVASFYTDAARKRFVSPEMVREIRSAVMRHRHRVIWGRDLPSDHAAESANTGGSKAE